MEAHDPRDGSEVGFGPPFQGVSQFPWISAANVCAAIVVLHPVMDKDPAAIGWFGYSEISPNVRRRRTHRRLLLITQGRQHGDS